MTNEELVKEKVEKVKNEIRETALAILTTKFSGTSHGNYKMFGELFAKFVDLLGEYGYVDDENILFELQATASGFCVESLENRQKDISFLINKALNDWGEKVEKGERVV